MASSRTLVPSSTWSFTLIICVRVGAESISPSSTRPALPIGAPATPWAAALAVPCGFTTRVRSVEWQNSVWLPASSWAILATGAVYGGGWVQGVWALNPSRWVDLISTAFILPPRRASCWAEVACLTISAARRRGGSSVTILSCAALLASWSRGRLPSLAIEASLTFSTARTGGKATGLSKAPGRARNIIWC